MTSKMKLLPQPTPEEVWRDAKRVLVLQGGGALGAYQAGVYEALAAHDLRPGWVAGISIGAINAALIAGNPPERRVERLRAFWDQTSSELLPAPLKTGDGARTVINEISAAMIASFGSPGFFRPRLGSPLFAPPGSAEALSLYDTSPLKATLERLVDFDLINDGPVRLMVGAVNVISGNSVIFDSARQRIGPEHIMASGALPPGFPPVFVDGEPYWDGGLVSNTPLQVVLDEEQSEDLLVFQIDLFNARGGLPKNLMDVDEREKDIRFSSRTRMNTDTSLRIHKAKVALRSLLGRLPEGFAEAEDLTHLRALANENAVTIVQLIYRKRAYEGGSKDYEFSRQTMLDHWAAGVADVEQCVHRKHSLLPPTREQGVVVIDPGLHD